MVFDILLLFMLVVSLVLEFRLMKRCQDLEQFRKTLESKVDLYSEQVLD